MIALYRLLPLLLQEKDRAYSGGAPGNLEKWVGCIEDLANTTEGQIKGLCDLIDPDLCPPSFIPYIAKMLNKPTSTEWPDAARRMFLKAIGIMAHISGTQQSWRVALKLDGKGAYGLVELWKSTLNETFDYSLNYDYAHTIKSARVDIKLPGDDSFGSRLLTEGLVLAHYRPIHILIRLEGGTISEVETVGSATEAEVSASATFTVQETADVPSVENAVCEILQSFTISGSVVDLSGNGIAGVAMIGLPNGIVTTGNGSYSALVMLGWTVTVTPTRAGHTFTPSSITYSDVTENQIGNYVGS